MYMAFTVTFCKNLYSAYFLHVMYEAYKPKIATDMCICTCICLLF